ncbi:MAG: beta-ketoacyl-ACP synthase III [Eubacteriales bacterium]|nr:beta-ketoacyl-ACP synthase III [Eubacteriales bacterium]
MNIKIIGMGRYLPKRIVTGEEVDKVLGKKNDYTAKYVGVKERRYANDEETVSFMAKEAILEAIKEANIKLSDIDAICYSGASIEQLIPSTACLIQRQLGLEDSGIACFDINSTCLSFVTALDTISYLIEGNRYKNVVIVSSEKASCGINKNEPESYSLFGDGAVACIVTKTPENETSKIFKALHKTYSSGADFCQIVGGGTKLYGSLKNITPENEHLYKFHMDGKSVFKQSMKIMPSFLKELFENTNLKFEDINMICPHQASLSAMNIMRKKLNIAEEKFMVIIQNLGNMISASIPMALYIGIKENKIKRGDKVMLIGTSAGLSLGSVILEY